MEDEVDRLVQFEVLHQVVVDEREVLVPDVLDVRERARDEVVDADHPQPLSEQVVAEMGAEEAGAASDNGGGHRADDTYGLRDVRPGLTNSLPSFEGSGSRQLTRKGGCRSGASRATCAHGVSADPVHLSFGCSHAGGRPDRFGDRGRHASTSSTTTWSSSASRSTSRAGDGQHRWLQRRAGRADGRRHRRPLLDPRPPGSAVLDPLGRDQGRGHPDSGRGAGAGHLRRAPELLHRLPGRAGGGFANNDLAVVLLDSPLPGPYAKLPKADFVGKHFDKEKQLVAAGFGFSDPDAARHRHPPFGAGRRGRRLQRTELPAPAGPEQEQVRHGLHRRLRRRSAARHDGCRGPLDRRRRSAAARASPTGSTRRTRRASSRRTSTFASRAL